MIKSFSLGLAVFFVLLVAISVAQEGEVQPIELEKISDRLYEVGGGRGARGGAYIGDDAVLVIDAKMDKTSVDQILTEIGRVTDKPIKFLVNTHSDGDHVVGNQFFPPGVTIISHENCRQEFFHAKRDGSPSDWNDPALAPFIPTVTFREKLDIHLGSQTVELWHFGVGHTTGDSVVYFQNEKTAFLGDQIFLTRPQLIHSYKGGNSFGHVKNLTLMLKTLDAERFCSGHGECTDRSGVEKHIAQMKARQKKVGRMAKENKSLEEIQKEFAEDEARLVESIYREVKASSTT